MKLTVNKKDYEIKFAYKPTIKGKIISRLVNKEELVKDGSIENIEELLEFIPEVLLIGLQKNHADEYGYDYVTNDGKEDALAKAEDLVSAYVDNEGGDLYELFNDLENELLANGFLAKMFEDEVKKMSQKKK